MPSAAYTCSIFRAALFTARWLPRAWTQRMAPPIAAFLARRQPQATAAMKSNWQHALGIGEPKASAMLARNVGNFSRTLADYFYCAGRPLAAAGELLECWHGLEYLRQAQAAGRGTILLTAHYGHWELGGALLAQAGIPMTVITLDEPSTALTEWREHYRRRMGISTILVGPGREFAFVEMLRVLRAGGCLAMLVDRPYQGTGLRVPFFGQEAEFSNGPALLWQHTGAAVIPAFVTQLPGGRYQAVAGAPLPFSAEGGTRAALRANTELVAAAFEAIIRQHPEQWYNYVPIWPSSSPHASSAPRGHGAALQPPSPRGGSLAGGDLATAGQTAGTPG